MLSPILFLETKCNCTQLENIMNTIESLQGLMKKIIPILTPHLDILIFHPLKKQFSEFTVFFKKDEECRITFGQTMAPLKVTPDDSVKAIPLIENLNRNLTSGAIESYELVRILLIKEKANEGTLSCYLHKASFVASVSQLWKNKLVSTKSVILPINSLEDLEQFNLPDDFELKVRKEVEGWIISSCGFHTYNSAELGLVLSRFRRSKNLAEKLSSDR